MTTTEPLTRERILAMQPGRELNALVSERVIGTDNYPFPYSSFIAAAWVVVEKLIESGWTVHVTRNTAEDVREMKDVTCIGLAECECLRSKAKAKFGRQQVKTFADGAPHAICLAALLTTLEES